MHISKAQFYPNRDCRTFKHEKAIRS